MMVYMVPLYRGAADLTYLRLFHSPSKACPRRRKHHHQRHTVLAMTNKTLRGHSIITFDTDGIPFIVNNSATCIITSERSLFVGNLTSVNVQVDTIKATQVKQQYEGTIQLEVVDDSNVAHTYDIPCGINDPSLQFNLLGISKLADFFQDKDYLPGDDDDSDGTTVKSSGCCSCLTWDHDKHTRNFTHGDSTLTEIMLYQGHGYFNVFGT
jgi:hypothetical protein